MPDISARYGVPLDFVVFFLISIHKHICISTKFSLILCLIDIYILIYRYVRGDCKLCMPLDFIAKLHQASTGCVYRDFSILLISYFTVHSILVSRYFALYIKVIIANQKCGPSLRVKQ